MASGHEGWVTNESFGDWNEISTELPPPPDEGIYYATFSEASPQQTKTGKPAGKLQLLLSHRYGEAEGSCNRKLFDNVVFTQAAAFRVKQLALGSGVELPPNNGYEAVDTFCGGLVDSAGTWLKLRHEDYTDPRSGETRTMARVDRYLTAEQAEAAATGNGGADDADAPERPKRRGRRAST